MSAQDVIYVVFLFALGGCVGSFLNVVAYRLPAGMSLVKPGSRCGSCETPIKWYDNIPILSWFLLRGRCRSCGAKFSIRYATVEFVTGVLFAGLYVVYFLCGVRGDMPGFEQGGWLIYGGHVMLLSVLLASSLIDADHMIIDLGVCRFGAVVGLLLSLIWPYVADGVALERLWWVIPYAGPRQAAAALGGGVGLIIGMLLQKWGILTRSYAELEKAEAEAVKNKQDVEAALDAVELDVRKVMGRELLFLLPAIGLGLAAVWLVTATPLGDGWARLLGGQKWLAGATGSLFGFMMGGGVVWATRILGSLAFGREAMGSGDIDLMATVGAVLGWTSPVLAFFVAPFLGLGWAILRLVLHGTREIPYGPFLSMGTLVVMVLHDWIVNYFLQAMVPPLP
ncbi:MAG: prepilin peptidase [Sedimentisphaerales bacterium]|nr:prepilin peptidase [Sedimentisphaerales bacterium]